MRVVLLHPFAAKSLQTPNLQVFTAFRKKCHHAELPIFTPYDVEKMQICH